MATPYVTPDILINAPTGISWETIPDYESTSAQQLAEQTNICWRATHYIDQYCNQPLRATIDTEEGLGPDFRITIDQNGLTRFVASRWPIINIVSGQWSPSYTVPPTWQAIPANYMYVDSPSYVDSNISSVGATGPSDILIAPGYISWLNGRRGNRVQVTYTNGYPHAGLIANVTGGSTTLSVDDCTGMAGVNMTIYDGANTEVVTVTSTSVTQGAGTATLNAGTMYAHTASLTAPLVVSSLPSSVQQAAISYATYITLTRGATATTVQMFPGATSGGTGSQQLLNDTKEILRPYRRVF